MSKKRNIWFMYINVNHMNKQKAEVYLKENMLKMKSIINKKDKVMVLPIYNQDSYIEKMILNNKNG